MQALNTYPLFFRNFIDGFFVDIVLLVIIISLSLPAIYIAYYESVLAHNLLTTVGAPVYECVQ